MPKLFLFDGTAIAYRAFFAFIKNPLRNSEGLNTSGVFGTINTLIKILDERKPDYIAFVFDKSGKTLRHEKFPEYKATREKMPDELRESLPFILESVEAMGIPVLQKAGVEADDILATCASAAVKQGMEVVVITGDKDIFQIINEHISILQPSRGSFVPEKLFDSKNAHERLGVPPSQIVDFLALVGDASDNIPGVAGIGKKTAQTLLEKFASLDGIYENLDELTKGQKKKMLDGRENAILSKDLVQLMEIQDFLDPDWESMKRGSANEKELTELLQKLELHALLKKLVKTEEPEIKVILVKDKNVLRSWLKNSPKKISIFLLWDGVKPFEGSITGAGLAAKAMDTIYVPVNHRNESELFGSTENLIGFDEVFVDGLQNKEICTYDKKQFQHLVSSDLNIAGTKLLSYLLAPAVNKHTLEFDALLYLQSNIPALTDFIATKKSEFATMSLANAQRECGKRAFGILKLHDILSEKLVEEGLDVLFKEIEQPLTDILYEMEQEGAYIDTDVLKELTIKFTARADELEKQAHEIAEGDFNLDSPKQLRELLFEKLKLPVQKKTKTGASTDIEVLEILAHQHPLPKIIVEYRHFRKLVNTYTAALPKLVNKKTGRIHSVLHQSVTATGRLSSSDPNLQNIPVRGKFGREIRRAFQAQRKGFVLLSADYSQIELRILAHISGDAALKTAFEEGQDIHTATAANIFGISLDEVIPEQRGIAKAVNYGIAYGLTAYGLSRDIHISLKESKKIIDEYFEKYQGVRDYMTNIVEDAEKQGFVTTLLGRKRYLPNLTEKSRNKEFAKRAAINTPIQGTSADLIKKAMIDVDRKLREIGTKGIMILQIHDELLLEVPEEEAENLCQIVKETMENALQLSVPIVVDVNFGKTWADIH